MNCKELERSRNQVMKTSEGLERHNCEEITREYMILSFARV